MKHIAEILTAGLAALIASSAAPRAADWAVGSGGAVPFGSVKDYQNAAVPVPAPTPSSATVADWYIRADLGYEFATNGSISTTGGMPAPSNDNLNGVTYGSVGFGRYITPSLRGDMTFDFQAKSAVTKNPQGFNTTIKQPGASGGTDTLTYAVNQTDGSATADQNIMFNLYHDFHTGSRFTPYIGGGLGIDIRSLKRNYSQNATCVSATNDTTGPYLPVGSCPTLTTGQATTGFNHSAYVTSAGVAAALMLGASYRVSDYIAIDTGYRMLWDGASITATGTGINGTTNLSLGDRLNHEVRTGVRIDLN